MKKFLKLINFLIIFNQSVVAHEISHFQQSDLILTVPIIDNNRHVYDKFPLLKLDVLDIFPSNSTRKFGIQKNLNYFRFNETTGELWLKDGDVMMGKKNRHNDIVITLSDDTETIETNLRINFVAYENIKNFCEESMCFYDSVEYLVIEDFGESFKSREIGEVAPRFYRRLCRKYHVEYSLLNASDILTINKNNKFITTALLDREKFADLTVNVACHIKSGSSFSFQTEKLFNFTILDLNDNPIRIQDNHKVTNLTLENQYFKQDDSVKHFVIFTDADSLDANDGIEIELLNDKLSVFKKECNNHSITKTNETSSTVFFCTLKFSRNGHFSFSNSEYCVTLRATEILRKKTYNEDATLCFYPHFEKLPTPAPLRVDDKGRKNKKITESIQILSSPDATGRVQKLIDIEYPNETIVLKNASEFARTVEPLTKISDPKIVFTILEETKNIFNITSRGGIIYIQNSDNLKSMVAARYKLNVSWHFESTGETQSTSVYVKLIDAENNCNETDFKENSCSIYETQWECENACGFGSKDGRCKWRPSKPDGGNNPNISSIYNTCVADLKSCALPGKECDQLEKESERAGKHICPQDCTNEFLGVPNPKEKYIKISPNHMCACSENSCHCGPGFNRTTTTTTQQTTTEILLKSQSVIGSEFPGTTKKNDCGIVCVMIMIGSPSLLVFCIIFLVTMRRRYVKKVKKRMMLNGSTVHYRGSNDTEIININILNEVAKENYMQTYQKFDFDAKWEVDRSKLIMDITLGEGEFGKVMKAYATEFDGSDSVKTVAVKTVKSNNNSVELLALLSEFQLLQEVSHPNVIKLLGACIKSEPPLMIIEYCCFGSLRSYLRLSRKLEESADLNIDGIEPVTAKDVLSFLWQICKGMAYLADIKLVHRDLAARNVLLAEGKVCKISDFGLTRDVYEDDAYLKKSKDRVPVKWMSPESLADHVYTTKTDVWSFGIVGWEIVTLGSTPYPGIPPQNLYHLLRSGYRMQRPENCSPEIYILLQACWMDDAHARPTFKSLASKFESLLGKCAKYLDVDISRDSAISNPLYLSSVADDDLQSNKTEETDLDYKRIDTLWSPPKFKTDISKVDNKKYLLKYDDQIQLLLSRYDKPKPLSEANFTTNHKKLRYQNDFQTFLKPNRYVNTSQPDLLSLKDSDRERLLSESRYDTPSLRRMKSYIEMRNIARVRRSSNSTTNDSFDDNNNEMPCANNRTTINENLNFNDLDKLLKADKEITFKFSSLNNLNQRLTETKC